MFFCDYLEILLGPIIFSFLLIFVTPILNALQIVWMYKNLS